MPDRASSGPSTAARVAVPAATSCDTATGRVLRVGPGQRYPTPSAAAAAAGPGDVIVIAAGDYAADVAIWRQSDLTLCGSGGRARLFAAGASAAGKGIWVIQGDNVVVDGIEFHGAKVPDRNGAGIRAEGRRLTVRNSGFFDNENGILGPDRGDLTLQGCEFARNGFGDGYSHNVYVGRADTFTVTSSFFHEARIGHNLKSRARETRIENSYFMDGPDGTASYQVDLPNGGVAVLRGNLLQKGPRADNSTLVSYGAEGLVAGRTHTLTLVHNTLVSTYPGGSFVHANPGVASVTLVANLFAGTDAPSRITGVAATRVSETHSVVSTAVQFPGATRLSAPDFWPTPELAGQIALTTVPDPGYLSDSPAPFARRQVGASRFVGALQAPP